MSLQVILNIWYSIKQYWKKIIPTDIILQIDIKNNEIEQKIKKLN